MKKMKNRWLIAASAVGVHISIGSVYAYSAWKMPLENTFGWTEAQTSNAFSIAIFFLGLSAAFLGRFIEKKGPSKGGLLAAAFFCTGLIGSALACKLENIWMFYIFYGVVSGIGLGLGYISPVSTLVKWFPDRRGLATGLAIMGFGFGGMVCMKIVDTIAPKTDEVVMAKGSSAREYQLAKMENPDSDKVKAFLAGMPEVDVYNKAMKDFEKAKKEGGTEGPEFDALKATLMVKEIPKKDGDGIKFETGVKAYALYSKDSIVLAFFVLGVVYLVVMVPSALYIAPPPPGYAEQFEGDGKKKISKPAGEMTAMEALKTPGFYGLWFMLFINVSCGIAVIATAKKMGYEMVHLPEAVASMFVMLISLSNGFGRILWASFSDKIGRANTYIAFFAIQLVAFPLLANITTLPVVFVIVTLLIITCYGGGFASIPAYISDLFGLKEMPTIHGFILTAWSMAGIVGPRLNAAVYEATQDYKLSLYIFGGAFVIALLISIAMKWEIKRLQNYYAELNLKNVGA